MTQLNGKKVLILVSNGVEEAAMSVVQRDLLKEGATIKTIGTEPGLVNSWNGATNNWGLYFPVDIQINQALGSDFDLLVVPGGSRSIAKLSENPHAERIIGSFVAARKPVCMMDEAVQLLEGHDCTRVPLLTGAAKEDTQGFVDQMIAHFAGDAVTAIAA